MDTRVLDALLHEIRPLLVGRSLDRPRLVGVAGIAFEVAGSRGVWLVLDVHRSGPALCLVAKSDLPDPDDAAPGSARQALLLFRKHAAGPRLRSLDRVSGEPFVVFSLGEGQMNMRLGPGPALSLVASDRVLATLGAGEAWPVPAPHPPNGLDDGTAVRPVVLAPRGLDELEDADIVNDASIKLATDDSATDRVATAFPTWSAAAAAVWVWRRRGERFRLRRRQVREAIRHDLRRKETLKRHLESDLARIDGADALRRSAEAVLAASGVSPGPDGVAMVPDPYEPTRTLQVAIDPSLGPRGTADRLFERARRLTKARTKLLERMREVGAAVEALAERARALEAARRIEDLEPEGGRTARAEAATGAGPRRYLTTRGLTLWVGRGAKENHQLTFGKAKPDDLWFHVRDRPGAHVILADNEGRAGADDQREAAEVAAFFSEAASEAAVDVHATRRKHLRPVKGSPGRVVIGYSETLRVAPRNPEGRLRKR